MKIFAGERLNAIMVRLKMPEARPSSIRMVTRSIETAQRKVEQRNFDIRKQLLEYDDVANDQRKVIYQQRNELLESRTSPRPSPRCAKACSTTCSASYVPVDSVEEQWDIPGPRTGRKWQLKLPVAEWVRRPIRAGDETSSNASAGRRTAYADKIATGRPETWHGSSAT